jgi:hypothetical protein
MEAPSPKQLSHSKIPSSKLEKSRRELKTLLFEKELVSGALTRLYEAEANGEITRDERETLAVKYREQLKDLNSEIVKIDAFIEVGDLEVLRDQLIELVQQKVEAIEKRIEKTRPLAQALIAEGASAPTQQITKSTQAPQTKPRVPDLSNMLEPKKISSPEPAKQDLPLPPKQIVQSASAEVSESNAMLKPRRKVEAAVEPDEVDQLQQELRDAMDRLEKLDLET